MSLPDGAEYWHDVKEYFYNKKQKYREKKYNERKRREKQLSNEMFVGGDLFANEEEFEQTELWDGTYRPPAPGVYRLRISEPEMFTSKAENEGLRLFFVISANADGSPTDQEGRKIREYFMHTKNALPRLKTLLTAAEVEYVPGQGYDYTEFTDRELLGTVQVKPRKKTDTGFGSSDEQKFEFDVSVINLKPVE